MAHFWKRLLGIEEKGLDVVRAASFGAAPSDLSGLFEDRQANSAVSAAARFVRLTLPEAPLKLWDNGAEGAAQPWTLQSTGLSLQARQALTVLKRPNPEYGGKLLVAAIAVAVAIEGNGYARIGRSGYTTPDELWYFPPGAVEPVAGGDGYLSHYMVTTRRGRERVERADMVHVRMGVDPDNPLLGISDLKSAAREVLGDNKAAEYVAAILMNPATGLMVSPTGESKVGEAELRGIVAHLTAKATGRFRFGTVGATTPVTIQEFGITPDRMPVSATRQGAIERILAVIGVDPMVIGLPSTNKTYSNLAEARRGAYKSLLIPLQGLIADEFDASFLSQFVLLKDRFWCGFDLSVVQELQEDENARWERIGKAYATYGGITRGEYRAKLGFDVVKARDDVFAAEAGVQAAADGSTPKPAKALKERIRDRRRVYDALGLEEAAD